ncbi:hypothetical protein [Paraburkholderia steynii]|nr:hypothetical protein [Paraburkholderia steynii]
MSGSRLVSLERRSNDRSFDRLISAGLFPSIASQQGAEMVLLVMQVAVSGELVEVFEMPVDDVDGHRMLACANEDERVIHRAGQTLEDGEVWIDLIDRDGETLFDQVACFHRADAADALQIHFGMNAEVVKDCLSRSNVASLYARHRVAAQAYFRKVDRLVDCSVVSSRQSNRRRVGDASVMDLVIELRRRLDGVDTLLALSELPTRVQAAAGQLKEAAKSYATAVQHL